MDITGVQVAVHKTGSEVLIQTEVIVGRELPTNRPQGQPHAARPHETRARITSQFLKDNVGRIEERLANIGDGAVEVHPLLGGSDSSLYIDGVLVGRYYYAKQFSPFSSGVYPQPMSRRSARHFQTSSNAIGATLIITLMASDSM